MPDLIGRVVGQYRVIEEIGRGGMANVYLAEQHSIGRMVAIKVLPAHFLQDPMFLERFNREVRVISLLEHPRILPIYDFGEFEGRPFIVMRYVSGGTLADMIDQSEGGMALPDVVLYTSQIAEGLDFAHEKGIIHRDFKPSNVLLDEKGNIYLADFGIAKVSEATAQLTGSGIIGTPAYMAPEMTEQGSTTHLIDVYAVGVTLYQMLSGQLPYQADTPMGTALAHVTRPIPDVRTVRGGLPDSVQQVVERVLAKDPHDRYQSVGEVAQALSRAMGASQKTVRLPETQPDDDFATIPAAVFDPTMPIESTGYPAEPTTIENKTVPSPPERAPRRRGLVYGLLVAVAVAAVVVGVMLLSGRKSETPAVQETEEATPVQLTVEATPTPLTDAMAEAQWRESGHADSTAVWFIHWYNIDPQEIPETCARCHSTPGYLDYMGEDGSAFGVVDSPAQTGTVITCEVCHNDTAESMTMVEFPSGLAITADDSSARCMICHQGRASSVTVNDIVEDIPSDEINENVYFVNFHYYAAGAVLYGTEVQGAYEYEGKSYAGRREHDADYNSCVECHDPHTLEVRNEECRACHADGVYNTDQEQIAVYQQVLSDAIQAYAWAQGEPIVYDLAVFPFFFYDLNNNNWTDSAERDSENRYTTWTPRLLKATYNLMVSANDPGGYAHNPDYILQILYDSIEDIGGDVSALSRP